MAPKKRGRPRIRTEPAATTDTTTDSAVVTHPCANPFCNAPVANSVAAFCEKSVCQLRRSLLLYCQYYAKQTTPATTDASAAREARANSAVFSIPKRKVPRPSPTPSPSPSPSPAASPRSRTSSRTSSPSKTATGTTSSHKRASAVEDARDKRRRVGNEATATTTAAATAAAATTTILRTTSARQAIKNMEISLVPLGVPSSQNMAGGGRYVQSGNRTAAQADAPVVPRPHRTSLSVTSPRSTQQPSTKPPTPTSSARSGRSSANTSPVRGSTTTSKPNLTVTTTTEPAATTAPVASAPSSTTTTPAASQSSRSRISASDYLSSRKAQDPRTNSADSATTASLATSRPTSRPSSPVHPSWLPTNNSSAEESKPPVQRDDSYAVRLLARQRDLRRSQSDSGARQPPTRDVPPRAVVDDHYHYDHYDNGNAAPRRDYREGNGYSDRDRHGSLPSGPPSYVSRHSSPSRQDLGPPPRHDNSYDRNYAANDYRRSYSDTAQWPEDKHRVREDSKPNVQRDLLPPTPPSLPAHTNLHPPINMPTFSRHNYFLAELLGRIASYMPKSIGAVTNQTKNARKMRFYLEYIERTEQIVGFDAKFQTRDGKGVLSVAGRDWIVIDHPSTVEQYRMMLEHLLLQAQGWRKLIEDCKRVYSGARTRFGAAAVPGMSFSRIWHAINTRGEGEFPLHRFVWYFRGEHRYHWKFCIENVEIGSGSHENKVEAFRAACADAMEFLLSLKLYPENGWHERRSTGKNEREKKTESGRNGRDDKSPNRSVSKPSLRSSVEKDHASTGNLRDTRSGLAREGGRASTPSRTADVEDMSMSEQEHDSNRSSRATTPRGGECYTCQMRKIRRPELGKCLKCRRKSNPTGSIDESPERSVLDLLQNGLASKR